MTLNRGLKRGTNLMHNTDIYLTPLILLRLCSNYTPSGISPGKIPSHPSHLAMLIAADLQVRARTNVPLKDSKTDGTARGVEGRGPGRCSAPVGSGSLRDVPAHKRCTCQTQWRLMLRRNCRCAFLPVKRDMYSDTHLSHRSFHACKWLWNERTQQCWKTLPFDVHRCVFFLYFPKNNSLKTACSTDSISFWNMTVNEICRVWAVKLCLQRSI